MEILLYFIRTSALFILTVIEIAMFARAIFSFLPMGGESVVESFAYAISEPFVAPVRNLMDRFEFARSSPIDISFFITFLLISIIQAILS